MVKSNRANNKIYNANNNQNQERVAILILFLTIAYCHYRRLKMTSHCFATLIESETFEIEKKNIYKFVFLMFRWVKLGKSQNHDAARGGGGGGGGVEKGMGP